MIKVQACFLSLPKRLLVDAILRLLSRGTFVSEIVCCLPETHFQDAVKLGDGSRLPSSLSIVIPKRRKGGQMQRLDAALLSIAMVVSPLCALARMSAATALRIVGKLAAAEPSSRS